MSEHDEEVEPQGRQVSVVTALLVIVAGLLVVMLGVLSGYLSFHSPLAEITRQAQSALEQSLVPEGADEGVTIQFTPPYTPSVEQEIITDPFTVIGSAIVLFGLILLATARKGPDGRIGRAGPKPVYAKPPPPTAEQRRAVPPEPEFPQQQYPPGVFTPPSEQRHRDGRTTVVLVVLAVLLAGAALAIAISSSLPAGAS